MAEQKRNSSIELLRIIAMMMVLLLHANFYSNPQPSAAECSSEPVFSFFRYVFGSLSVIGVNLFVIISGYFGIHPTAKKLVSLLFQCCFYQTLIMVASELFGFGEGLSLRNVAGIFLFTSNYWFIKSYILLFLLAPALNLFAESVSRKEYSSFLLVFLIIQGIYGWTNSFADFREGYSSLAFVGLYMLAAYFRKYPVHFRREKITLAVLFVISVMLLAGLGFLMRSNNVQGRLSGILYSYICPVVIIASFSLFGLFRRIRIESKVINCLAVSAFSVYLIHFNDNVVSLYVRASKWLFNTYEGAIYFVALLAFVSVVYLICFCIDRVRLILWTYLSKKINWE